VGDQSDRLGSSGVFKAIVDSARKFKRAVTGGDEELPPEADALGNKIAQAFVGGKFADIHALGTPSLQKRSTRDQFVASWRDAIRDRGPFTGFEVANAGQIDLGFIPGLEETPQSQFVAFLEIAFSSPDVPLDDDKAFTVGVVLLDEGGQVRLGALHLR
jgi:hypothetical protein